MESQRLKAFLLLCTTCDKKLTDYDLSRQKKRIKSSFHQKKKLKINQEDPKSPSILPALLHFLKIVFGIREKAKFLSRVLLRNSPDEISCR